MGKQLSSRSQESAVPALEERVHRLEVRTEALADAVRLLARGLEAEPMAGPAVGRPAEAARRAHELLLAAESAPPVDPGASEAHPFCGRYRFAYGGRRSGAVGVTSVIYVEDVDDVGVLVDRIADAVLAAPGSPLSLEGLAQGGADSARPCAEGAASELETGPRDSFG